MTKKFLIVSLYYIFLSLPVFADNKLEIDFEKNKFYFHWGSQNRTQMLKVFKFANLKNWDAIVGVKKEGNDRMAINGPGLYLSELPHNSDNYGPQLVVVEVPKIVNVKAINRSHLRWRLMDSPNSNVRFIDSRLFFETLLTTNQIDSFDLAQQIAIGYILFSKQNLYGDLYNKYKQIVASKFNMEVIEGYYFSHIKSNRSQLFIDLNGSLQIISIFAHNPEISTTIPEWVDESIKKQLSQNSYDVGNLLYLTRRFVDEEHFQEMLKKSRHHTEISRIQLSYGMSASLQKVHQIFDYDIYGQEALNAWLEAYYLIEKESLFRLPKFEDYLSLHEIAYPKEAGEFVAFNTSSKFHSSFGYNPRGQLRNGPIYMSGGYVDSEGSRHALTALQIESLTLNPNLTVEVDKKEKVKIIAPYSIDFESEVKNIFLKMEYELQILNQNKGALKESAYIDKVLNIVGDFYWELSTRHPFWDGSGRTTRLIRDWVLLNQGITPPNSNTQFDWEMSKIDYIKYLKNECRESKFVPLRLFNFSRILIKGSDDPIIKSIGTPQEGHKSDAKLISCQRLFN